MMLVFSQRDNHIFKEDLKPIFESVTGSQITEDTASKL